MPRAMWSGSLSFGLVNVPVALFSATRDRGVHFNQLHEPDRSPIQTRRVCELEGHEVGWEEIAKGYELPDGRWVLLFEEDLEAAAPARSRTIDIERFVHASEIDPVYYEHPYLLVPREEGGARAYALLNETMRDSGAVALGRFVLRARERLAAIRSREGALTLSTMRFHDEVRSSEPIGAEIEAERPGRKEIDSAVAVIEELSVPFEPGRYRDEHRARLRRIIKAKQAGKEIVAPSEPEQPSEPALDLMSALEQSLEQIRAQSKRRKRGQTVT
jgi:DNA end-binding protein Ku